MTDCNSLLYEHYYVLKRFSSDGLHIIAYDIMQANEAYLGFNGEPITQEQLDAITAFYNCSEIIPSERPAPPADNGVLVLLGLGLLGIMLTSKKK